MRPSGGESQFTKKRREKARPNHGNQRLYEGEDESGRAKDRMRVLHDEALKNNDFQRDHN